MRQLGILIVQQDDLFSVKVNFMGFHGDVDTIESKECTYKTDRWLHTNSDGHLVLLLWYVLLRYHYREAVVVSALQVLKYPLTMPGPATATNVTATPPTRHLTSYYVPPSNHHAHTAWSETMSDGRMSKLGGAFSTNSNTPMHSPSPIRPNHSPKIKLK